MPAELLQTVILSLGEWIEEDSLVGQSGLVVSVGIHFILYMYDIIQVALKG